MPSASEDSQPTYRVQSLSRGIAVLRTLAEHRGDLTLTELHEHSGIPKPTLVRLLSILTDEGCTVRVDDRPTYALGPAILEIAAGVDDGLNPETLAQPHLERLTQVAGNTANLGVLSGNKVLHVCVNLADRPVRYTAQSGTRDDVWCTGLGKALLAFAPGSQPEQILEGQTLEARTDKTITSLSDLEADLEATRERGWSHDDEEGAAGLRCFAVPVVADGTTVAALSVSGPAAELSLEHAEAIIPHLNATAADLAGDPTLVRGLRFLGGL